MNVREFAGSKRNNLVDGLPWDMIYDQHDPNPERRFKRVTWWKGPDVGIWFSPDGIRWKPSSRNPVLSPTGDTHSILGGMSYMVSTWAISGRWVREEVSGNFRGR